MPADDRPISELLASLCDETISTEEMQRLDRLILADAEARRQYLEYLDLHARLSCSFHRPAEPMFGKPFGNWAEKELVGAAVEHPVGAAVELPHQPESRTPNPESPFPPIILDLSPTTHYPPSTSDFIGSWAFACMVATVIVGAMLLGFWAIKVTHHQHFATAPSKSVPSDARPEFVFVGRITGLVDVKWSDDPRFLPPYGFAYVPLGGKYILDAGLMEITYDSGAKVILQGPCTYEVESSSGGYLALGKLTTRVESGEWRVESGGSSANQKSEIRNQKSSALRPPPSAFVVRTPTALVTDLGTEFGVEVSEGGTTTSHVFRGSVKVLVLDGTAGSPSSGREVILGENESARVQHGRVALLARPAVGEATENTAGQAGSATPAFVRQMPRRVAIKVFNTGLRVWVGEPDPHWQIVARSDDPNFTPRPAVVMRVETFPTNRDLFSLMDDPTLNEDQSFLENDTNRSQWISTAKGMPFLPNGVTYSFRTTFELAGLGLGKAVLRGQFIADNHVGAIRLNGQAVPVPEHGYDSFNQFHPFTITEGFVEGTNVLEIDVVNGDPRDPNPTEKSPMSLRVELQGLVVHGGETSSVISDDSRASKPRKGGELMNGP
ncbi:MAG: FecR family protein [Planctomycetes bacterium]|nr:FecR family protein [Planctomycetota bacterium]